MRLSRLSYAKLQSPANYIANVLKANTFVVLRVDQDYVTVSDFDPQ